MIFVLCGFMVFTTGRFMLRLALFFVHVCFVFCSFSIVVSSFGEVRAGLCASRAFVLFVLHALVFVLLLFLSGLAAACDCDTLWTFLLTILIGLYNNEKMSTVY